MKKQDLFHHAGTTVALMVGATLVSKVLGMLRQMMTASIFAASMEGIAFSAASGIPLAIFDMLFSTAVLGSFLPIYKGHLDSDEKRAESFSSSFLTGIFLITALVSLLGIVFARPIVHLSAPDLDEDTFVLAVLLLRIMFPSMIFAGMAYTLVGILQSRESFLLPALISAVSNLMLILYLVFFPVTVGESTVIGFAAAYLLSWSAQFLTLAVPLWKKRRFPSLTLNLKTDDTVLAVKRAIPVMFGSWLVPMTNLIAKSFSSFVDAESIEQGAQSGAAIVVYENAFSVFSIAAGLLTYGVCNYLFPKLSSRYAAGDGAGFSSLIQIGSFAALATSLPVSATLFLLSQEIAELLYLRGSFTPGLAFAVGESLKILSLALPVWGMTEFFSRACYACGKVRYPMRAALSGISASLAVLAVFFFTNALSVVTVAISVVLGQVTAGIFLLLCTRRLFVKESGGEMVRYGVLLPGITLSFISMWICRDVLRQFLHFSKTFQNFLVITIVFTVGFMVYSIWLILSKAIRPFRFRTPLGDKNI